ncbi:hypothetical protein PU634_11995 [Oceanimonas pelagia]|uniref:Uncharacterized protein n=1 Tax=Oceanimonas pelagia TaxID=3028314 RepID=A0AA50QB33_9GAMM|nr:hypothetical protein [Oceanimonas pelagia]WMC09832.1 hypothetical protein PU634_11995 [Oceanimonas pelagia]
MSHDTAAFTPTAGQRLLRMLTHGTSLPTAARLRLYALVAAVALAMIWLPFTLFMWVKPVSFTSNWILILPGTGAGYAVSLDSVGQASASATSPYNSHSVDPRVNYKAIATSAPVLDAAAADVGLSRAQFGKPDIRLVDQTALMKFRLSAPSAGLALRKAEALDRALQQELERLRRDEFSQREHSLDTMLNDFSSKLGQARQRILEYQSGARIVSLEQFNELTLSLERMRGQLRELKASAAGVDGRRRALQQALAIDARQAAELLTLQQDVLFRELATAWAAAATELKRNLTHWGERHRKVVAARDEERQLRRAMHRRVKQLAPSLPQDEDRLLSRVTDNIALYSQLVELMVESQGLNAQIAALGHSIDEQQQLLEQSTQEASLLEDLKRKHQVATAVFGTGLAKLDIGKGDKFSAYPMTQLLSPPSRPDRPDTLGRNLALLGCGAASLFIFLGLVLLWIRKPYLQKHLKNA